MKERSSNIINKDGTSKNPTPIYKIVPGQVNPDGPADQIFEDVKKVFYDDLFAKIEAMLTPTPEESCKHEWASILLSPSSPIDSQINTDGTQTIHVFRFHCQKCHANRSLRVYVQMFPPANRVI